MKKLVVLSMLVCVSYASLAFSAGEPAKTETPAAVTSGKPAGHPGMPAAPAEPAAAPAAAPAASAEPLKGTVVQTMNGGGYTYVYLEQADGKKVWVAVSQIPVKVGSVMTFKPGINMGNFESKALKRTFDSLVFSDGVLSGAATEADDPAKGKGVSPGSGGAVAKGAKISVPKATGANSYTVEEAFKNSAKLNKKKVVIKGQVVKFSSGIMDRNWIHIQDGTGSDKKKTHNLVCTSSTDRADVGDVVTISGTLIKDKDFGAGYKYAVIIEDAKVSK